MPLVLLPPPHPLIYFCLVALTVGAHLSHALGTERRQLVGELDSVDASLAALRATTEVRLHAIACPSAGAGLA